MREKLIYEQEIIANAAQALLDGDFKFYLQPKCNMKTNKIIGSEALVRWHHKEKGMISPNDFIPLFERNGFVKELDMYIWEEVIRWLKELVDAGIKPLPVSVNVSRIDLLELDVYQIITNLVEVYGIDKTLLKLEVTESAYVNEEYRIIRNVDELRKYGFEVLLDDFGSGYSSLNILKEISIDALKLDMRFLDKSSQKSKDVLLSITNMARWLNLITIAEGVETQEQVDFLLTIGCSLAQGYYFYKPMSVEHFTLLLNNIDNIDHGSVTKIRTVNTNLLSVRELLYENLVSNTMLNNVLGSIAIFYKENDKIYFEKGNDKFLDMMQLYDVNLTKVEINELFALDADENDDLVHALELAKELNEDGSEITIRGVFQNQIGWLRLKIYFLSKINDRELYYTSISDVSKDMELIEQLQISEQ